VAARESLEIWVGADLAIQAAPVLSLLAVAAVFRAPTTVTNQVCNGLGKGRFNLLIATALLVTTALPVALLTPQFGAIGAAIGTLVGTAIINPLYDVLTQWRFLHQRSVAAIVRPYVWTLFISMFAVALASVPALEHLPSFTRAALRILIVLGCFLSTGAVLRVFDVRPLLTAMARGTRAVP
jgi:O-antigen/teichoic acid export membrane protein